MMPGHAVTFVLPEHTFTAAPGQSHGIEYLIMVMQTLSLPVFSCLLGSPSVHYSVCSPLVKRCVVVSQVAYFVNSGSEANDMAILLARLYSGNHDLIALRNCYHGISEGLLGVLGHSTWKYNVPSVSTSFSIAPCPDRIDFAFKLYP